MTGRVKHAAANGRKQRQVCEIKKAARTGPPHSDNSYLRLPTILMIYRNRFTKSRYN